MGEVDPGPNFLNFKLFSVIARCYCPLHVKSRFVTHLYQGEL